MQTKGISTHLYPFAIAITLIIAIGTIIYVINHEPMLALPDPKGTKVPESDIATRVAAADIVKETVGYIASLTVALAAVAAFLVKDGFGAGAFQKSCNIVLTASVAYYLIKSLLFAYDAYGMIAIQLSEGYFYISRVQQVISSQAQTLLIALVLTTVLINARIS
ncbi:hypothetical protein [Sinorhizobium sojae]|uniref:hypothetical protein n=1 Tax=Sinorhizobium sojae TaxID=716925 RepID=UPI00054D1B38|nr:hypothetical protein [Sinorhizobium sojae]